MATDTQLLLHETRAGEKRAFEPIDPERVTIYLCGPTVYNFVHIGNARPPVVLWGCFEKCFGTPYHIGALAVGMPVIRSILEA